MEYHDGVAKPAADFRSMRIQSHRAATFAVASELLKRGYTVEVSSSGTHADLTVVSPNGIHFSVIVSGLHRANPWWLVFAPETENSFRVLAFVPPGDANRFFVMTEKEAIKEHHTQRLRLGRSLEYKFHGFNFGVAFAFENKWESLPG